METGFFHGYVIPAVIIVLQCLAITVPLLLAVAYMTYADRKIWASIQLRRGPNVVGPFGLLQPMADGLKLVLKETIVPSSGTGILFLFAISSLGVYGIIIAGWASNSKYAFLGALRSAAQMVSYEVSIGFVMVTVLLCVGSLNLSDIVRAQRHVWFAIPLLPMFAIFFISALAE